MTLKRETGSFYPKVNPGRKGRGKLEPYKGWLRRRVEEQGDTTLDQLARELMEQFDVEVHRWSVCRVLHGPGLSHKKRLFMPKSSIART